MHAHLCCIFDKKRKRKGRRGGKTLSKSITEPEKRKPGNEKAEGERERHTTPSTMDTHTHHMCCSRFCGAPKNGCVNSFFPPPFLLLFRTYGIEENRCRRRGPKTNARKHTHTSISLQKTTTLLLPRIYGRIYFRSLIPFSFVWHMFIVQTCRDRSQVEERRRGVTPLPPPVRNYGS